MAKKYYITTPIYYINDVPHLGHAYTTIAADVLARFQRSKGNEVFFLTGVDEHGAKIAQAAETAGKTPQQFVDDLVPVFQNAWEHLNISYDEFFRTTNVTHEKIVQELVGRLVSKGFVEKRTYTGLYCVGCEKFLLPDELVDGKCPDHGKEPIEQSEENYFFLLSKFEKQLEHIISTGIIEVGPESRKNEVLGKIKGGLEDISISRKAVEWGVKFPGDDSQTVYVWVDALLNYYTAKDIYNKESWEKHPADLHLMAKDILWFHAVIWPAMLLALDLPLPAKVFSHGYFTVDGKKMSKTIGNVLDPIALSEKFGADAVRYAVLREFPFGEDGDISEDKIALRYKNDLGNELGNLLQRTLSMINKYNVNLLPREQYYTLKEYLQADEVPSAELVVEEALRELKFDVALKEIWRVVQSGYVFIDEKKPWALAKNEEYIELERVLNVTYLRLKKVAKMLAPFMPETSEKMMKQLESLEPEVMFPRIEG